MNKFRTPVVARPDGSLGILPSPSSPSPTYLERVRELFVSLTSFLRKYELLDPAAFNLAASATSLCSRILGGIGPGTFPTQWESLRSDIGRFIDRVNHVRVVDLCASELDALQLTFDRAIALQANTAERCEGAYNKLSAAVNSARGSLEAGELGVLREHLISLRSMILSEGEGFSKMAQTVIDQSRHSVDKAIGLVDIAEDIGQITLPAVVGEISEAIAEGRSARKTTSSSGRRRAVDGNAKKTRPVPTHRSGLESHQDSVGGRCDAGTQINRREGVSASSPLNVGDSDSSDGLGLCRSPSRAGTSFTMSWLVDIELSDDGAVGPMMAELVSFERRFGRYVAAVGTNKLLGRFLDEIGVAQRLIQTGSSELSEHFTRMQSTIAEIQSKMAQAEPVYQSEARFEALALALSRFRRGISNPDGPSQARIDGLLADLTSRWQSVQRSQSLLVQGGMDKSSHPLNETVDAQLQEVPHILERCYSARASITEEMRVIHARLAAIQAERRLPDADLSQLDTEFQDLNGNLNRLIERLSELP